MKKLIAIVLVSGFAMLAEAGSYVVYIKMPNGTVITHEMPGVPSPDSSGMYRFNLKGGGSVIVHASNVWIEEKSGKARSWIQK